jgi:hypothetical protein
LAQSVRKSGNLRLPDFTGILLRQQIGLKNDWISAAAIGNRAALSSFIGRTLGRAWFK